MTCPDIEQLEEYLTGTGSRVLEPHVASCPSCQSVVEDLRENLSAASGVREAIAPPAERIGAYRLVREIGRGGMGVVYEAEQERTGQRVALKLLSPDRVTATALARFEHEARVLARLRHPGVARILEAGTDGAQRPYLVIELVRGESLTRFAERAGIDLRARLDLLIRICDAVQHAHAQSVIHRDLKPANILVVAEDAAAPGADAARTGGLPRPRVYPKILDFGVARIAEGDPSDALLQTRTGQVLGTTPYMSPEQASGDPHAVDTRSDVYSLGVVAYELLGGRLPYEVRQVTMAEAARRIREVEPPTLGTVDRALRGDVETIVRKALEKDKERRYQSAGELAADVRRYLNDEPIVARPPSTWYQLRKLARRNRALFGGVAAGLVLLLIGSGLAAWQAVRATRAEREARAEAEKASAVNEFLQTMLSRSDPDRAPGDRDLRVSEVLARAVEELDGGSLADQPALEAAVRATIGNTYRAMGLFAEGEPQLRRAVELGRRLAPAGEADLAYALNKLSRLYLDAGRFDESEAPALEALALYRRIDGPQSASVAKMLNNLGWLYEELGRSAEAEQTLRDALEMRRRIHGDRHTDVANTLNNLAVVLWRHGNPRAAEPLLRASLEIDRAAVGVHPHVAGTLANLAQTLVDLGEVEEAEALAHEALEMSRTLFGEEHPQIARRTFALARVRAARGELAEAEALLRAAISLDQKLRGPQHPAVADMLCELGTVLLSAERADEAAAVLAEALAVQREALRPANRQTRATRYYLLCAQRAGGGAEVRCGAFEELVQEAAAAGDAGHWLTGRMQVTLGECLAAAGRTDEALTALRSGERVLTLRLGAQHPHTRAAEALLAGVTQPD